MSVLSLRGITKSFGGLQALKGIDLDLEAGEILALVGDNGAGKSTMTKIVSGVETADSGTISVNGKPVSIREPNDARAYGIETLHQHLGLVNSFGVVENLFLGREITGTRLGVRYLKHGEMRERAKALMTSLGIRVPSLDRSVSTMSGGQRQAIAISRLLLNDVQVIIMDEPMAALGVDEGQKVLDLIVRLSKKNVALLVISHNLEHVFSVAHRIAVFKNGGLVGVVRTSDVTRGDVTSMIINGTLPAAAA
ncbi:MAG: ATP-binding cassette domain-containing protein [Pseudorhodoplanes sp.]